MDLIKLKKDLNGLILEGIIDDKDDHIQCVWGYVACSEFPPSECKYADECAHARPHPAEECGSSGPCVNYYGSKRATTCSITPNGTEMPYYE
jgi:hypothetical protein